MLEVKGFGMLMNTDANLKGLTVVIEELVLAEIANGPVSIVELEKRLGATVRQHIQALNAAGKIRALNRKIGRAWVLIDWVKPAARKPTVRVLEAIRKGPPRSAQELADHFGIGKRNLLERVAKLRAMKQVRLQKLDGEYCYVPTEYRLNFEQLLDVVLSHTVEEGDCALWQKGRAADTRYPIMRHDGRTQRVHNVLWEMSGRDRPEGTTLIMTCGNKDCVLPEHTKQVAFAVPFQLAAKEGKFSSLVKCAKVAMAQRKARGRFTPDDVLAIRSSELTNKELAAVFNCNKSSIGQIRRGDSYKVYSNHFHGLGA